MTNSPTKKPTGSAIASPLAALVAKAAGKLPAETGATAKAAWRRQRGDLRIVLADISDSMTERAGARSKIEILRDALRTLPASVQIVAFHSAPIDVPPGTSLPPPGGSTALHLALRHVAAREPTHILVVSDGHPDDARAALAAADALTDVQIDVIYCGPDNDREGMAFMRRLARGGGQAQHRSMAREPQLLASTLRTLALPKS
ncbi:MAG TPA: hypothetical protein DEF16_02110 [Gemmobacter sp.]|nr:hypothetical protein [Gemmobacter sp.]HBU13775.1 hypothetical protein [Gemmobacter sp.]